MTSWNRAGVSLSMLALVACTKQTVATTPAVITRDTHAAYQGAAPAAPSCAGMGPWSCDLAPSSSDDLCTQLAKCLAAHDPSKANIHVDGCGELSTFEPAPDRSGVRGVAVINVDGSLDGQSGQGSYLVAEREGGFCLVDQAVGWSLSNGGYLDTDSRLTWRKDQGRMLLSVRTQALYFAEGDEDDEEGTTVQRALCRDADYALEGGRFTAVRERAANEPCTDD